MVTTRRLVLLVLGLVAVGFSSCSNGRIPTVPVSGKVLWENRPLAHATVVLHPTADQGPNAFKPRAVTKDDGTFSPTTYDGNDGAPAGEYQVTVELYLSTGRPDEAPTSRLPFKYARPETSGISAKIEPGSSELKAIELKR